MANTIIAPGLRADIMRRSMECKNTLTKKGSLYVGQGEVDDDTICQTEELVPGDAGTVLVSKGADGIGYRKLSYNDLEGQLSYDNLKDKIELFNGTTSAKKLTMKFDEVTQTLKITLE